MGRAWAGGAPPPLSPRLMKGTVSASSPESCASPAHTGSADTSDAVSMEPVASLMATTPGTEARLQR